MATLFDIKNVAYLATLRTNTGFKVSGDLTLFSIPYLLPLWVIATVTYPKQPLDVLGAPEAHMGGLAVGTSSPSTSPMASTGRDSTRLTCGHPWDTRRLPVSAW